MRFRGIIAIVMLIASIGECAAQADSILISGKDTIHYKHTPMANSASVTDNGASPLTPKKTKLGFFGKIINYFESATIDKSFEKPFDTTFVIAPYYTTSTSLSFTAMLSGLFRIDKKDRTLPPSTFNITAQASISGFYKFEIDGASIFKGDKQRLIYDIYFSSLPTYFWGFGYSGGLSTNPTKYIANNQVIKATYLYRLAKNTYIGAKLNFNWAYCSKEYREALANCLNGLKTHDSATGLGLTIEYDSRDFIPNPSRGIYLAAEAMFRPKALGSIEHDSWKAAITADYYQKLWKGAILAVDLHGEWNSRNTPWVLFAQLDGRFRMRGYYEGRFMDYNLVTAQVELRQHLWYRLGAVFWGGAGNVFSSFDSFKWSETLPNYGIGLRWEFKKRINLRLDLGFGGMDNGKIMNGFLMSINEAF